VKPWKPFCLVRDETGITKEAEGGNNNNNNNKKTN
jgi:hypothetical protein